MKTLLIGSLFLLVTLNAHALTIEFPVLTCMDQRETFRQVQLDIADDSNMTIAEISRIACLNIDRLDHRDNRSKKK